MTFFRDISHILRKQNIFLLGSYNPNNIENLRIIKIGLIENGIINTYLALDKENLLSTEELKNEIKFLRKVRNLLKSSDFNIFILFQEGNDSVIGELGEYIKQGAFKSKLDRTLICLPRYYSPTIILGIIGEYELPTFEYDDIDDIIQYSINYIKRNMEYG